MARIALKVDVDTWRGTREGVPALMRLLGTARAGASFLFSLGPDHTGRAISRAFSQGFLRKVSRTSVLEHYGLRTLLSGSLLPGPDIGKREAATMRAARDEGFETGVHCWDHVRWQDHLLGRNAAWAQREMRRAIDRYGEVFSAAPRLHGAAGWQFNEAAARAELALGIEFASDTRGSHPFVPAAANGELIGPPQFPTTLPTLDELIGLRAITADTAHRPLLALTEHASQDHVYTLHAELEGMKLQPVFEQLIVGWRAQGHTLVTLGDLYRDQSPAPLPRHLIQLGTVPGRGGRLAVQGALLATDGGNRANARGAAAHFPIGSDPPL